MVERRRRRKLFRSEAENDIGRTEEQLTNETQKQKQMECWAVENVREGKRKRAKCQGNWKQRKFYRKIRENIGEGRSVNRQKWRRTKTARRRGDGKFWSERIWRPKTNERAKNKRTEKKRRKGQRGGGEDKWYSETEKAEEKALFNRLCIKNMKNGKGKGGHFGTTL